MFGDLFGSMEQKQKEIAEKAAEIRAEATVGGVKVVANGAHQIVNISIGDPFPTNRDASTLLHDREQLEDLLITAANRALADAAAQAAQQAAASLQDMLPLGFGDMFK